jgi:acetoin utilization protein AcuB
LPVVRDGVLIGIITESDLFKLFQELLGARKPGVRVTLLLSEARGQLAKLTAAIAGVGGDILALGTFLGEDPTNALVTVKVAGVPQKALVEILQPLALELIDVREV